MSTSIVDFFSEAKTVKVTADFAREEDVVPGQIFVCVPRWTGSKLLPIILRPKPPGLGRSFLPDYEHDLDRDLLSTLTVGGRVFLVLGIIESYMLRSQRMVILLYGEGTYHMDLGEFLQDFQKVSYS